MAGPGHPEHCWRHCQLERALGVLSTVEDKAEQTARVHCNINVWFGNMTYDDQNFLSRVFRTPAFMFSELLPSGKRYRSLGYSGMSS